VILGGKKDREKSNYNCVSQEIAEHLMDLKIGMEELKKSKTFKEIIRVLREIGNFLNSCEVNKTTSLFHT
jgi:hypothetical protein